MFAIDLNHPDVQEIQKHAKIRRFKKGMVIVRRDDDTNYLHIVISGLVKAYTENSRGEETITVIYGPDDIFPLSWIINQERTPVDFGAIADCEIALIPRAIFLKYLKESPDISYAVMQKILEQYIMFGGRIINLEFKFARERLAYRLLSLAAKFGEKKDNTLVIPHISQNDLGVTINLSREHVSKEMARFEQLGLVKYDNTGIYILDVANLHKECGKDTVIPLLDTKLAS